MKKSLPQSKTLARKVRRRAVDQALDFLASKRVLLQKYRDVEDFVFEADFEKDQRFSGIEHNFVVVRAALARTLWANHIYLGICVVDSLIFQSVAHKAAADPILDFLETVRGLGLHRPGLVLYPVHSLGLIAGGLLQWVGGQLSILASDRNGSIPSVRRLWKQTFPAVFVDALSPAPQVPSVAKPPPIRAGVFNRQRRD